MHHPRALALRLQQSISQMLQKPLQNLVDKLPLLYDNYRELQYFLELN